jgi:hypothetical protein
MDNECICGGIGTSENDCMFSNHSISGHPDDHETETHVCLNCPCNYTLISYTNLYLNKIYTQVSISYTIFTFFNAVNFDYLSSLIRPPRPTT